MTQKTKTTQKPIVDDGYEIVKPADLLPFVNWENTSEIEGEISDLREIVSEYGKQEICTVGDFTVGITTALRPLLILDGAYVRIRFEGYEESAKGRQFKNFTILRRKALPPE